MSDNQNQSGAGRLRWWQDDYVASPSVGAVAVRVHAVAAELAPPVVDIGEELEAEALRRSLASASGAHLTFQASASQMRKSLRRPMERLYVPLAILGGIIPFASRDLHLIGCWLILVAYFVALYIISNAAASYSKSAYARLSGPVLTVTREGVEIHDPGCDIGLVYWNEIAEVRAYSRQGRKVIGIVPRDDAALGRRLTSAARAALNEQENRFWRPLGFLYRKHRGFTAPINVMSIGLPAAPAEIVREIETFRREQNV